MKNFTAYKQELEWKRYNRGRYRCLVEWSIVLMLFAPILGGVSALLA